VTVNEIGCEVANDIRQFAKHARVPDCRFRQAELADRCDAAVVHSIKTNILTVGTKNLRLGSEDMILTTRLDIVIVDQEDLHWSLVRDSFLLGT
jgi:hypothetical protein